MTHLPNTIIFAIDCTTPDLIRRTGSLLQQCTGITHPLFFRTKLPEGARARTQLMLCLAQVWDTAEVSFKGNLGAPTFEQHILKSWNWRYVL